MDQEPVFRTGIELNDSFTEVVYGIINSVNLAVSAMEDMQNAMNADIDTGSLADARSEIDQAAAAVQELEQAMAGMSAPAVDIPQPEIPQPVPVHVPVDVESGQVINVDVNPVIPDPLIPDPQEIRPDVVPNAPPEIPQPAPVQVPVEWQADGLDIFTGSGMERFQQEAQSVNAMLQQLGDTQDAIAKQAYNTNIFPPEAFQNLNSLAVRIDNIRSCIQQIENNPINMGTDAANRELEQMRAQLSQAVAEQNNLNAAMDAMDVPVANDAYLRLSRTVAGTERYLRDNVDEQGRFNREVQRGVAASGNLRSMIASAVGAFAGMAGIRKAVSWIQECTEAFDTQRNAELQLMTVLANTIEPEIAVDASDAVAEINGIQGQVADVTVDASADTGTLTEAFDAITAKASEIQSRGIYGDEAMIAGAAEFSTYFSDTDAIEMMMNTLTDYAMGMSGGGALDSTAMVEYATGLGKIMSGSYDAMTKKGFEFTEAQKAVIEGTATQEQIIAAIGEEYLNASEDVRAAAAINAVVAESWDGLYESMSNTPQGKIIQMTNAWGDMKEVVGGQLYPYVILFVDAITSHWGTIQSVLDGITLGLQVMMGILSWLLEGALDFSQAVIDNWSWISPIVYGLVTALTAYAIISGIVAVANGVHAASEAAKAAAQTMATGVTLAETAAQHGLNAALAACPLTWIILLIIALVAVIFAVCNAIAKATGVANSGFGVMTGGVNVVIQFFKNLGLTVANIALGIWNAIGALAGNMKTAFHNTICSIQSWFYGLLATGLTVIEGICASLNKLPFVDIDYSGISNAADDYAAKAAEAAGNKEEYTNVGDAFSEGINTFDTFRDGWASDAFAAGAAWGDGIADKVSSFSLTDLFATDQIPSMDDYASEFGESMAMDVSDIAGNTGSIKDSLSYSEENLKYLRDLAEQESVNRYTTAEINIDMSGMQNTVNNGDDLDGFMAKLVDSVSEAVDSTAEGVHE